MAAVFLQSPPSAIKKRWQTSGFVFQHHWTTQKTLTPIPPPQGRGVYGGTKGYYGIFSVGDVLRMQIDYLFTNTVSLPLGDTVKALGILDSLINPTFAKVYALAYLSFLPFIYKDRPSLINAFNTDLTCRICCIDLIHEIQAVHRRSTKRLQFKAHHIFIFTGHEL